MNLRCRQEDFVHLHVRTPYSFYEGAGRIEELVEVASGLGQAAIAFTDRNRTSGLVRGYKAARAAGVKPVLGLLLDDPKDAGRTLMLWARNLKGYGHLGRLAAARQLEAGFTLENAVESLDDNVLAAVSEPDLLEKLYDVLPPGTAFGELTLPRDAGDKKRMRTLYEFSRKRRIPLVVTGAVSYATPDQAELARLLRAIGDRQFLQKTAVNRDSVTHRPLDDGGRLLRAYEALPEALHNTRLIADQCEVDLRLGELKFPEAKLPRGVRPFEELRSRSEEGLRKRYGDNPKQEARERLAYELGVIDHLGFTGYILTVHDIAREAWRREVRTLGRGSAANSMVCYCLGLTDICPLRYNLYFERFLNPERKSPPDIDLDFSWRDRDEILEYVFDEYGHDHVGLICTTVTFKTRGALRETALARGIPEDEISRVTKRIPWFSGDTPLAELKEAKPECRDLPLDREPWRSIAIEAEKLRGLPRHLSIHAGGVVITPGLITDWSGLEMAAKGFVVTQYDMYSTGDLGLVKIDLLSQRALGVLKDAVQNVERNTVSFLRTLSFLRKQESREGDEENGVGNGMRAYAPTMSCQFVSASGELTRSGGERENTSAEYTGNSVRSPLRSGSDRTKEEPDRTQSASRNEVVEASNARIRTAIDDIESLFRDKPTWDLIRTGQSMGCFYIESPGMRALLQKLDCDTYDLLVAASSVIRPGVSESGMMQQYIDCVRDPSRAIYLHPKMKEILGDTHGVMIYQEDVIKVAHHLAGISLGRADTLRRAMSGKGKTREEMQKMAREFITGCRKNGVSNEIAGEIWRQVESFAGYAFCKAHSASFAVLSVQIAYLRAHHPAEFMAAVLANGGGFYSQAAYVEEARRLELDVCLPHVNRSELEHVGAGRRIQLGLKGIGVLREDTPDRILDKRAQDGPFRGLEDFAQRIQPARDEIEALISCGAFDGLDRNRPTLLRRVKAGYEAMKRSPGPLAVGASGVTDALPDAPDWTDLEKALAQRRILGFSPGPHPLALLDLPEENVIPARELLRHEGRRVTMLGWAYASKRITTRVKKETMQFLSMEDLTGTFEVTLFPRVYRAHAPMLHGHGPFRVTGRVEDEQGVCTLVAEQVEQVQPRGASQFERARHGGRR